MLDAAATRSWHRRLMLGLLLAPALIWLFALIVLPHLDLALLSFRERTGPREFKLSFAQYHTFFTEPLYWHVFARTAAMSAIATLLTPLIAFPVAWTITKLAPGRLGAMLFMVCLIPFWVSETVRTLGWMILLRESGVLPRLLVDLGITTAPVEMLYHDATILVGLVYTSMLFMVVPLVSALESLDDSLIEAAYDLGGDSWSILRQIVVPHAARAICGANSGFSRSRCEAPSIQHTLACGRVSAGRPALVDRISGRPHRLLFKPAAQPVFGAGQSGAG